MSQITLAKYPHPEYSRHRVVIDGSSSMPIVFEIQLPPQFDSNASVCTPMWFLAHYLHMVLGYGFFLDVYSKLCLRWALKNDQPVYVHAGEDVFDLRDDLTPNDWRACTFAYSVETHIHVFHLYFQNYHTPILKYSPLLN